MINIICNKRDNILGEKMSVKRDLKQTRLPFQILTSPKASTDLLSSSSTTSITTPVASRKRRPSSDGENLRSTKIVRTKSKENIIAEQDPVVIDLDNVEQSKAVSKEDTSDKKKIVNKVETTPTASSSTNNTDSSVRIKLPSRRKQNFDSKINKSHEEIFIENDDSVVYLDEEELPKKVKKSAKKSDKKKQSQNQLQKKATILIKKLDDAKKSLNLNDSMEDEEDKPKVATLEPQEPIAIMEIDDSDYEGEKEEPKVEEKKEFKVEEKKEPKVEEKKEPKLEEKEEEDEEEVSNHVEKSYTDTHADDVSEEISKLVEKSPSTQEDLHEELIDLLSDDGKSPQRSEKKSPSNDMNESIERTTPKLTPKALARRKELEAKRIEKEHQKLKEREEKDKQRLLEKQMREDAKRKEREEKEELRKREKEEREKKKQAELEKKEEEKRAKEEERLKREEEKKRLAEQKEEERRQKEEEKKRQNEARDEEKKKRDIERAKEEERKKKAAEAFTKFFVPKKKSEIPAVDEDISRDSAESVESSGKFMPFQIRGKMRLAPCVRLQIDKTKLDQLDEYLKNNNENVSYLKDLKNGMIPKKTGKTWPEEDKDEDVVAVDELEGVGEDIITSSEEKLKLKHRAKLLLFNENRRPAFYGTWRKNSKSITGRRPFAFDKKFFDYEVDSDEEWEEEDPGESLHGSDSEKEKETYDDDYELDNDFFVPHGHLSEEELQEMDDEIDENNTPEMQKAKLKIMHQEFAAEMKKKTEKIKPRLIGCIWMNGDEDEDGCSKNTGDHDKKYHCSDIIWRILKAREMMTSGEEIKLEDLEPEIVDPEEESDDKNVCKTPVVKKMPPKIDNESIKELTRLVHGNINSRKFIIREFQAYRLKTYHNQSDFQEFSVKSVDEKMSEISEYKTCPEEGPLFGKKCWFVKSDIMKEFFGDEKLALPNRWTYILEKKSKTNNNGGNNGEGLKKSSREVSPEENSEAAKVNETCFEVCESPNSSVKRMAPKSSPATTPTSAKFSKTIAQSSSSGFFKVKSASISVADPSIKPKESPTINHPAQSNAKTTPQSNGGKKRVALLMSVKPGQNIDEEKKKSLISQFLKSNQTQNNKNQREEEKVQVRVDGNDVIEIIE